MSRWWAWGLVFAGVVFAPAAGAGHDRSKGEQKAETAGSEVKQEYGEAKTEAKGSAPATGMATTESGKAEQTGSAHPENTEIIRKLYSQSALDAETANIAQQKSQDEQVKKFADELARDHKRLGEKLEELAAARSVKLSKDTALSSGQKAHVEAMKRMSTSQFEEHFKQMMVQDHDKLVKDIETALAQANSTGDRQLAAVLQEARPSMEEHHATAMSIGRGGSSAGTGSAGSTGSAEGTKGSTGSTGQPEQTDKPQSGQRP